MNKIFAAISLIGFTTHVWAEESLLTGIPKLACEAIICLSTGSPPGECSPSLSHYFNIDFKDFSDTIKERLKFLRQCPAADSEPKMSALVTAIANGAGRCDAKSLNATLIGYPMGFAGQGCISNKKPSYCTIYDNHEYTDLNTTNYVIDPPNKPYWPFNNLGPSLINGINGKNPASCGHWVDTPPTP